MCSDHDYGPPVNRRYLLCLCVLVTFAIVACTDQTAESGPPKPGEIVLLNPGFEMPNSEDLSISGWNTSQHAGEPAYEMVIDDADAASGKRSFRMTQTQPEAYGMLEQHVASRPDLVGKTMRLTARMKTTNVGPNGWTLFLFVADGTDYVLKSYESPPVLGTTEWQQVEVIGKVLPNTARFTVGAHLSDTGNGGVAWLDDVELRVVEDESPAGT